ncbi:MAG: bifunctional metallophosphatase/5'-nucleotidase [Lachnospiraceae bacterium]|nr:bifunctional metallophosphatase/5'-nucleotidase [Lachnospiraceae bacterium]
MKKRILALCMAFLMVMPMVVSPVLAVADEAGKKVDAMFLHDTHSHLKEFATVEGNKSQTMGGFARIKTLINAQLAKNPDTLLLDAGDFSMGTLVQVVYEEEAAELRMLGELGMVATTFGNHEFDYGAEGVANMLNSALASGDSLPEMLICNVDWDAMNAAGLTDDQKILFDSFENYGVREYMIVEKGGVSIAITGVMGANSVDCIPNCPLVFEDAVTAVKETVAEIKEKESVDMIVCISHSGTWTDESKSEDEILAKEVPELDVIVSGHTHTQLPEPIQHGETYIVSCGEYGKYLGSLSMSQKDNGRWNMDSYELKAITSAIEEDAATKARVDYFMSLVDDHYLSKFGYTKDQVLCTNEIPFATVDDLYDLHTELNLGSLIADAYAYAVENAPDWDGHPVDVAVAPSGTIRETYALGNITVENVFNSFSLGMGQNGVPGYPLISVYLTGEELKLAAEIDASISDLMTTARLYTYGLRWSYNPNRMILNKTTDVYIMNRQGERVELENDKLYRVVTDMYTALMLGGVTDMSFGLLSLVPKQADGTPLTDYNKAIIYTGEDELKAWTSIAQYMESFEDTDGDGVGNVPVVYGTTEGRKVVEDSKALGDLLKNPNKFFWMILGIVALVLVILVVLIIIIVKVVKVVIRKMRTKKIVVEE